MYNLDLSDGGYHRSAILRGIAAVISVTLSILYISLDFYYYLEPEAFVVYQASNLPYQLSLLVTVVSLVFMLFFGMGALLNIRIFERESISEKSLLTIIWIISLFIIVFLVIFIYDTSTFYLSMLLGVFLISGIFIFVFQTYQGLEEKFYAISTCFFSRNYPKDTKEPQFRKVKRRMPFIDDLDYDFLITKDHLLLIIFGILFLLLQGISAFSILKEIFVNIVPLLRDLFSQVQLGWIVEFIFVPLLQLILTLSDFLSLPFKLYFDAEFLSILGRTIAMFSSFFILFLFLSPVTRETASAWRGEMQDMQFDTFKGGVVRNNLYRFTKEGAFYLYCFGRVSFSFLMSYLLIIQMESGALLSSQIEIILYVLASFFLITKGMSRFSRRVKGLHNYDSISPLGQDHWK